jgi:hypothetical protein
MGSILTFFATVIPMLLGFGAKKLENDGRAATNAHDENRAAQEAYAKEFSYGASNRNWFDSAMDGINRMPRPMMAMSVLGMFYYAVYSPARFAVVMQALSGVPPPLWTLLTIIVSFYFVSRVLEKVSMRPITRDDARRSAEVAREVEDAEKRRDDEQEPTAVNNFTSAQPAEFDLHYETPEPDFTGLELRRRGVDPELLDLAGYRSHNLSDPASAPANAWGHGWTNPICQKYA